jgi:hypothetical protein
MLGVVSSERMEKHFRLSFSSVEGKLNYTGTSGIGFRIISVFLFTSIIILFATWYCSRNAQRKKKENNLSSETPPVFTRARKIILVVAGVFLLGSILAQVTPIYKKLNEHTEKTPPYVSSEFEKEEDKYKELGEIGEMKIAKVKEEKEGY